MDAKDLRGYTLQDLMKKSKELRDELFGTRLQNIQGSLENTSKIRQIRRDIARVETLKREKVKNG